MGHTPAINLKVTRLQLLGTGAIRTKIPQDIIELLIVQAQTEH